MQASPFLTVDPDAYREPPYSVRRTLGPSTSFPLALFHHAFPFLPRRASRLSEAKTWLAASPVMKRVVSVPLSLPLESGTMGHIPYRCSRRCLSRWAFDLEIPNSSAQSLMLSPSPRSFWICSDSASSSS